MTEPMETYRVRVSKDYLTFCAGHFITFDCNKRERLHGHNYRVAAEIVGDLNPDKLVFDFVTLKRILREITDELDHFMMIPTASRQLNIEFDETRVRLTHEGKEWIFPRGDCVLLDMENTTAELLARWLTRRLREEIDNYTAKHSDSLVAPRILRVEVEETPGQSALYEWKLD